MVEDILDNLPDLCSDDHDDDSEEEFNLPVDVLFSTVIFLFDQDIVYAATANALPTELQTPTEPIQSTTAITYNPFSPDFKWTGYNIAAVTTAAIVVGTGLAILTTLFFPMFVYKICYALGGCQTTLDEAVDRFLGVHGRTRRIKRDTRDENMDFFIDLLKMSIKEYGTQNKAVVEREPLRENVMSLTPDRKIEKRSPIDYIEPILVMLSRAYDEYINPELKKNFKKPPSIR
ncbi:unnamed protein product [Ceutorhynchus assimilis]|uniref:Uncharacterized protein n=1 Tax=Ceutorhynchus assimilis TaxID=467358 RepID=A0A9N9MS77_9CUCU|nr:unnamed protein product [Ceutorhynchus assimilis]